MSENGIIRRNALRKNEEWGIDSVQDRTAEGCLFRMLVVLDEYTPDCLAIELHRNHRGEDIVTVLNELKAIRGVPTYVRTDNGPDVVSKAAKACFKANGNGMLENLPESPWQNGIPESSNGWLRDDLLSSEILDTLPEARYLINRWRLFYNHQRIQRALDKVTPATLAATYPALPPRRPAAATPGTQGATTKHHLSEGVAR